MWYPPVVVTPPEAEPVTVDDIKTRTRVDDTADDADIALMLAAARAHVEAYCGTPLVTRTVQIRCDRWSDLRRLGVAPVQSVQSVTYLDTDGVEQTLAPDMWELRAEGDTLDPAVVLAYGQQWPTIRPESRVTVTAVAGYSTVPDTIVHAVMLLTAYWYEERSPVNVGNIVNEMPFSVEALLSNHRRGV